MPCLSMPIALNGLLAAWACKARCSLYVSHFHTKPSEIPDMWHTVQVCYGIQARITFTHDGDIPGSAGRLLHIMLRNSMLSAIYCRWVVLSSASPMLAAQRTQVVPSCSLESLCRAGYMSSSLVRAQAGSQSNFRTASRSSGRKIQHADA